LGYRGIAHNYRAPDSNVEKKQQSPWSEVLDVGMIGAEDSFFVLGVDSLLATSLVSLTRSHRSTLT
jgi:hypothetical protein